MLIFRVNTVCQIYKINLTFPMKLTFWIKGVLNEPHEHTLIPLQHIRTNIAVQRVMIQIRNKPLRLGCVLLSYSKHILKKNHKLLWKKKEKSPGRATIINRSPSQTPRGRGNRQNQTIPNRTNVRKAPRLALSSPREIIAMLKGL